MQYSITYRRKDGNWQYIINYKVGNKWKQKSKQGFKTKKDAKPYAEKEALQLIKNLSSTDLIINNKSQSLTFSELSDLYIEHIKLYKEYKTTYRCKSTLAQFDFGDMKVNDIKKIHVQSNIDNMVTRLTPVTIRLYLTTLRAVFKYYKDNFNSLYEIDLSKIEFPKKSISEEKRALTKIELDNLLFRLKNNYQDKPYLYIGALLAGTCGLRLGEIQGLTWNDIIENNTLLNVDKQYKILKDGTVGFGDIKNKQKRRVPLPSSTLKELLIYKKNNPTDINNRIIAMSINTFAKYLYITLKAEENISIHELRHTYATLLVESNTMDFKTIAKILGHDINQTLKTYSHVTDSMFKNAQNQISKIF